MERRNLWSRSSAVTGSHSSAPCPATRPPVQSPSSRSRPALPRIFRSTTSSRSVRVFPSTSPCASWSCKSSWFAESSADVLPDRAPQLDRVVDVLAASPHLTLSVVGHTDQRGAAESNLTLSRRRAEAVVSYIVNGGIDGGRLSAWGRGEADPLSLDDDAASLALIAVSSSLSSACSRNHRRSSRRRR
jgi:outer membrane protein OmpA-like peptidoglycan-associated protein